MSPFLLWYLAGINVITLAAYAADKYKAVHRKRRVRVVTLLGLALIGGSVGALIAMYAFRHKTRKACFTVGVPVMLIMQIAAGFLIMNAS